MTNETNEQKPLYCNCTTPVIVINSATCGHCRGTILQEGVDPDKIGSYARTSYAPHYKLPPQEVESKGWTYVSCDKGLDIYCNGSWWALVKRMEVATLICDRFNELDRLRSSMGKVPSDVDAEEYHNCLDREKYPEARIDHHYAGFMLGAKWMRSEVAPVIAKLEDVQSKVLNEIQKIDKAINHMDVKRGDHMHTCIVKSINDITALLTPKKG